MWVEPGHRRTGALRALLLYLTELEPDVDDWLLWVLDGNAEALAVYKRLGFEPTGESQLLKDASGRAEVRLRLKTLHARESE